jgi:S1-C subfamily serine protease
VWTADTQAGRAILGGNKWLATFVENFILVRTPEGWKIVLNHASQLPADLGVEVDYHQEGGGAKIAQVSKSGPAEKAGLKSGDVLIDYGGQKIDTPTDFERFKYVYAEGEKVIVTVMRGNEKIAKEVTLEAMR